MGPQQQLGEVDHTSLLTGGRVFGIDAEHLAQEGVAAVVQVRLAPRDDPDVYSAVEPGERFDVIVFDPPAFIKRRKDMKQGRPAYRRLNEAALGLLERDGLLISASCSFHLGADGLLKTIQQAARHSDRNVQVLRRGYQGPDHPVHPAIPETGYLKAMTMRVLPTQ